LDKEIGISKLSTKLCIEVWTPRSNKRINAILSPKERAVLSLRMSPSATPDALGLALRDAADLGDVGGSAVSWKCAAAAAVAAAAATLTACLVSEDATGKISWTAASAAAAAAARAARGVTADMGSGEHRPEKKRGAGGRRHGVGW